MTSNMIYIVALGVGFKCPRKIHLNTQWGGQKGCYYTKKIPPRAHLPLLLSTFTEKTGKYIFPIFPPRI